MRTELLVVGLLHLGGVALLPAQQRADPFVRWEHAALSPGLTTSRQPDEFESLGDYRYEGLAFGGFVFGVAGAWAGSRISAGCLLEPGVPCPSNKAENAVALGLAGAALGGGLGYLVGRLSPKRPARIEIDLPSEDLVTVSDSVRKRTGYHHWRGAAIGLAVGGAVGALTGVLIGDHACSDCDQQPNLPVALGLMGGGTGGVLGFLAGLASPRYIWVPRGTQ